MMSKNHGKALNIFALCFEAQERGHEVFFYYAPHVSIMTVEIFVDEWHEGGAELTCCAYTNKETDSYTSIVGYKWMPLDEITAILVNLINEGTVE